MTRKKKMRRVWNTNINPVMHAIMGAAITPVAELNKLRVREMNAIDAFVSGSGTLDDFAEISAALTVCEHLALNWVGAEALDACHRAQETLIAAAREFESTKSMSVNRDGEIALRDLYDYYDLQRQSISNSELQRAIKKAHARVANKAPGVVEL